MRTIARACLAAAVTLSLAGEAYGQSSLHDVRIGDGQLRGVTTDGVAAFKGIPFAAPPIGKLRWRPPQPEKHWRGVKLADKFGDACTQAGRLGMNKTSSEDCLYLNVWTPAQRGQEKLPVMVWIYGGAFISGAGSFPYYDGAHFAQQGVVLVTFNYRLGRFGFFAHPALTKENSKGPLGNYGLMDQIAALKWVRKNIAAFGGDPAQVTIFGESAGAMSVNDLMISPAARGLFSKAISESGFGRNVLAPIRGDDPRAAEAEGEAWALSEGVGPDAPVAKLRAIPAAEVAKLPRGLAGAADAAPMLDGVIMTEQVATAFAAGRQAKVPYLLGGNSYEASLFHPTPETVLPMLGAEKDQAVALFGGTANLEQTVSDMTTDRMITEPNRYLASQMANVGEPAYLYYFSYVPEAFRQNTLGLPHGGEIGFVFGNLRAQATAQDRATSDAAMKYWVAFAKTGNPGDAGGPTWPAYTIASDQWLEFGDDGVKVRAAFRKPQLDWIEAHLGERARLATRTAAAP